MKREFKKPTLEVVEFNAEDVIQTSGCTSDGCSNFCGGDSCAPKCYVITN